MDRLVDWYNSFSSVTGVHQALIIAVAIVVALLTRLVFARVVVLFTRRTKTDVDDRIVRDLRGPVAYTIVLGGVWWAIAETSLSDPSMNVFRGLLISVIALTWAVVTMRVGTTILEEVGRRVDQLRWLQPKTLPLFEMVLKVVVVGGLLYFGCIAWGIPLTSWLTSAGIVGIAVGFAAKDTLANLFSGIFIIADAPYKEGDFIVLDNGLRGIVADIGIRSTRLLTRDDIEVTVPNAAIGNAQIVNETGGPHDKMRVRVKVSVAYGSDVDQVQEVLLGCANGVEHVSPRPEPRVRFREFGDSGLLFELLAWIDEPLYRGRVLHTLNTRVYKAFGEAGIEIPYAKFDLYIKEQPMVNEGGSVA
jgi:small-conductance mechanosensitive channel